MERQKEILNSDSSLGVFEETARLNKVIMWGTPGTETVLGQLLPKDVSCFEDQFDVLGARAEFNAARAILEANGVEIIQVKDLFAKMITEEDLDPKISVDQLREGVVARAFQFYETYKAQSPTRVEEVLGWMDQILEEDIARYGEKAAVAINHTLALSNDLPMSNVLYARDQSNLLAGTMVWSSMRHKIRQPEVELFKKVLNYSGIFSESGIQFVQVGGCGRFEGGDGIVNAGVCYIGVGGRTNMEGVLQVAGSILEDGRGLKLMVPFDEKRDQGLVNEMDAMHLDTFWMPSDSHEIVACQDEIEERKILEIEKTSTGLNVIDRGWFADHLAKRGVDLVPLSKGEQLAYAPNFLNLGDKRVVLSLTSGNELFSELGKRGKEVYNANLKNITKGFGGLHCMTAAIARH